MPKENVSDRNGRALEYKIIDFLCSGNSNFKVTLTDQAKVAQGRDKQKYLKLSDKLKESYIKAASIIHNWLLSIIKEKEVLIDRLSDNSAKKGDVTDIRISWKDQGVNLSIKHNHSALKHQRPPTTVMRCGYAKDCQEDIGFRKEYKKIVDNFLIKSKRDLPGASLFSELLTINEEYINDNIYFPVCSLVAETIKKSCISPRNTEALFNFLIGSVGFYKIIDRNHEITILDFTHIKIPKKVDVRLRDKSYVDLDFSNGCKIAMRLHNASSRLGRSLKFDTQAIDLPDVQEIIIKKIKT
ncbi:MAG: HaeIII family restriction endonuclease [Candidatus Omnitrophota bacterium]|jgi:hypothetical protein